MIDIITVIGYLLGHSLEHPGQLKLSAHFFEQEKQTVCAPSDMSPSLRWSNVPPQASSLAILIKDAKSRKTSEKMHYYWIVYNLPIDTTHLSLGENHRILRNHVGMNSWKKQEYHSPCYAHHMHPVTIELLALDTRIAADKPLTGEQLERAAKKNIILQ